MFQMNIQEVVENIELSLRRSTASKFLRTVVQLLLARKEQRSRVLLLIIQQV